jgi:hypothetical protein
MKLRTECEWYRPSGYEWSCLDDDTYDGAPDSGYVARIVGYGRTARRAILDWRALWADAHGADSWEEYVSYVEAQAEARAEAHEKHTMDCREALDDEFGR